MRLVSTPVTGSTMSAMSVMSQLMRSIMTSTPMSMVTFVTSCVTDCAMPEDMVSTSFVMRESTSPTVLRSK